MARDILKVRKVGGTLVVTITQAILDKISLVEGDRVLIEAVPPKRILITKEEPNMPNTRRIELELQVLEARKESFESQMTYSVAEYNQSGTIESSDLEYALKFFEAERDKVAVEIAQKRLDLFEMQGA